MPVDPRFASKFDPERVPTVGSLLRELNEAPKEDQTDDASNATVRHGEDDFVII